MLLRLGFGATLLVGVGFLIDGPQFVRTLRQIRLPLAIVVVALTFSDRVMMAIKWTFLARALGVVVPFSESLRAYLIGSFAGLFLPTSFGSDVIRLFNLTVDHGSREEIAASIIVERLVAFLALLLLLFLSSCSILAFRVRQPVWVLAAAAVSLILAVGLFFVTLRLPRPAWIGRLPRHVAERTDRLLLAYQRYRAHPNILLLYFMLSFLEHGFPVVCNYLTAVSLHLRVNIGSFFVAIPFILVVSRLPVSVDGLGVQEALYPALFHFAGLSPTDAVAMAVTARVLTTLASLPGGILLLVAPTRVRSSAAGAS